jgi:hypothetical protein
LIGERPKSGDGGRWTYETINRQLPAVASTAGFSGELPKAMKYKKKPVEIQAVQYTGNNEHEIMEFAGDARVRCVPMSMTLRPSITIDTLEGVMTASEGDFIIRGVKGELYPCKPDIFAATYEAVDSENSDYPHHST